MRYDDLRERYEPDLRELRERADRLSERGDYPTGEHVIGEREVSGRPDTEEEC